jgi:hypothetical protein
VSVTKKASIISTRSTARVSTRGRMTKISRNNGRMVSSTAKESFLYAMATSGRAAYDKREKESFGGSHRNLWSSEEQSKDGNAMADECKWLNYDL